jgi:hypothetical protein
MVSSRAIASALPLLLLAGCSASPPVRETIYSPCHIIGTSDWKAEVELFPTSSPIPYVRRKLVVTGKITTDPGFYRVALDQGPVSRLDDPVQQVLVRTEGAAQGGAPVTHNVRGVFSAMKRYGGVAIRCGDGIVAEIREVTIPPRDKGENPFRF